MDLVKIEKIRTGLDERLRAKGFDKMHLSLDFDSEEITIKVEAHNDIIDKCIIEKRLIKFRDLIKIKGIDDVTYIQQEVNHIEYLLNQIINERLKEIALTIAETEGKTNGCIFKYSGYIFYINMFNDNIEIIGKY